MPGDVVLDTRELERKMRLIMGSIPDHLRKELRKEISRATKIVVDAQRAKVKSLKSSGSSGSGTRARLSFSLGDRVLSERSFEGLRKRSGLRAAAAASVRTVNRTTGTTARVSIRSEPSRMPADQRQLPSHMNAGRWRHPILGNRSAWVTQSVEPGWFDKPAQEKTPDVVKAIDTAVGNAISNLPG